jgi:hypothetical protein
VNLDELDGVGGFLERYGPLFPGWGAEKILECARAFRLAWTAKTESAAEAVNGLLDSIFSADMEVEAGVQSNAFFGEWPRPAVRANFLAGKWEVKPRDFLLDHLAITLMHSRRMLALCGRSDCERYFVKAFSRDKYCSSLCGEEMRSRGQRQWQQHHRRKLKAHRRKHRRAA